MDTQPTTPTRGRYNEITSPRPEFVRTLLKECETAGAWETGIVSDRKQRGTAINVDVYGYDEERDLAVVQVRQCVFHPRRFNEIRKNYYLIGHNPDSGTLFTHPIPSPNRAAATRTPEQLVAWAERQIWGGLTERQMQGLRRQGDVALLPAKLPPDAERQIGGRIIIRDTHQIVATRLLRSNGDLYAINPCVTHTRQQHRTLDLAGTYRVLLGYREKIWNFSLVLAD